MWFLSFCPELFANPIASYHIASPRSDYGNYDAYYGLLTWRATLRLFANMTKLR
ncbi:unnamed protein product [Protopolystoma xenopodis]|uniref:Uncharacterized protein n=1 Tax=Protopolystoma xenopodis TaxID=117903 RepID=A0A448XMI2_9PLAT|nr:unnamed protein product [Protopolystoma xenopodis]